MELLGVLKNSGRFKSSQSVVDNRAGGAQKNKLIPTIYSLSGVSLISCVCGAHCTLYKKMNNYDVISV